MLKSRRTLASLALRHHWRGSIPWDPELKEKQFSGESPSLIDQNPICVQRTHMTSADVIRELQQAGWILDLVRGSHHVFRHPARPGIVVAPHPKKDPGGGRVSAIRKQAGL